MIIAKEMMMSDYKTIDPKTAHEWLENDTAILVDVREADEHQAVRILNSHLLPVGSITADQLPVEAKSKKVIVHCKLGKRGEKACEKLKSDNPNLEVYNLAGGIVAWEDEGLKVHKS